MANAVHTLAFDVRYRTTMDAPFIHYDVGDQLAIESGAFISANARDEADFSATGEPIGPQNGSFSARADRFRVRRAERDRDREVGAAPRG